MKCEVLIHNQWHEAIWQRRIKRSGGRAWHVVKLVCPLPAGDTLLIPACGLFMHRCQIRKLGN